MSTFIKKYTNQCERCARMKPSNLALPGKLHPLELPDTPWTEVTADFTTDLPLSKGFNSILVVVNHFSKEVEFIPCNKTTTALDTAQLYLHNVWKNHGLPNSIVSDRGPQFASQVMRDLCTVTPKTLSILTSMVVRTAHHQKPWELRLALVELKIENTLGYKIASWVM